MTDALSSTGTSSLPSPLPVREDSLILQIPTALLISIFSMLSDNDQARISRVCRRWRVIYVDHLRFNIALNLFHTSKEKIRKEHLVLETPKRVHSSFLLNREVWGFQTESSIHLFFKEKEIQSISDFNTLIGETDNFLFFTNSYSSNPSRVMCLERKTGTIVFNLNIQKFFASEKKVGCIQAIRVISEEPFVFMIITRDGAVSSWQFENGFHIFTGEWHIFNPDVRLWGGSDRQVEFAHFLKSHLVVHHSETRQVSDKLRGSVPESRAFLDIISLDTKEKIKTSFWLRELNIFDSTLVLAKENTVLGYNIQNNQLVQTWEYKISTSNYNLIKIKNDKSLLLIAHDDRLHIIKVNTGKKIQQLSFTNALDPIIHGKIYGSMLALVCAQHLSIFDLRNGTQVTHFEIQKKPKQSNTKEKSIISILAEINQFEDFDEVYVDVEFIDGQMWYPIANKKTGKVILEGLRFIPEFKKPVVKVVVEKQPDPERPPLFPQPTIPHPPATSNASPPKKPETTQKISYLALSIVLLFAVSAVVHFGARYPRIRLLALGAGSILAVGIAYSLIVRTKKQMSVLVQTIGQLRHVRVWS